MENGIIKFHTNSKNINSKNEIFDLKVFLLKNAA